MKPGEYGQRSLTQSDAYLERAQRVIPGVSQTFSKNPNQFVRGVSPAFIERGQDGRVWDVDGNEFIDMVMGCGPVTLGHNHPVVNEAIKHQLMDGILYSMLHPLEVEVAEKLVNAIESAEMVKFSKNFQNGSTPHYS